MTNQHSQLYRSTVGVDVHMKDVMLQVNGQQIKAKLKIQDTQGTSDLDFPTGKADVCVLVYDCTKQSTLYELENRLA